VAATAKGKDGAARAQAEGEADALRTKGEAEATYAAKVAVLADDQAVQTDVKYAIIRQKSILPDWARRISSIASTWRLGMKDGYGRDARRERERFPSGTI
jgi:hypothetical protein